MTIENGTIMDYENEGTGTENLNDQPKLEEQDDLVAIEQARDLIEIQSERLTIRTMADYVKEYIIGYCDQDPAFVMHVKDPEKSFMGCIGFIKDKARDWLKEQQKLELSDYAAGIGGDVPNDICYQWAIEYYFMIPEPKSEPKTIVPSPNKKRSSKKSVKEDSEKEKIDENQHTEESASQISFESLAQSNTDECNQCSDSETVVE